MRVLYQDGPELKGRISRNREDNGKTSEDGPRRKGRISHNKKNNRKTTKDGPEKREKEKALSYPIWDLLTPQYRIKP